MMENRDSNTKRYVCLDCKTYASVRQYEGVIRATPKCQECNKNMTERVESDCVN